MIYFADTGFLIGLLSGRDEHHRRSSAWRQYVLGVGGRIVTTDVVLWEFLNAMAAPTDRGRAGRFYLLTMQDPTFEVIPSSRAEQAAAVGLYASRPDKGWSLTDCRSFLVMQARGLTSALTADHHFQQAGFAALLLTDPPAESSPR